MNKEERKLILELKLKFKTNLTKTRLTNFWINQDEGKLRLMVHLARLCRS